MGISTIQSYCGAQIFEAVGEKTLIDRHFTGTASRIGGIGLGVLAREALDRHSRVARLPRTCCRSAASTRGGETVSTTCGTPRRSRCCSTRSGAQGSAQEKYDEYMSVNPTPRGGGAARLLAFQRPRPVAPTVQPAKEIVKRFATGAMSLVDLHRAHETLAIAMNRRRALEQARRGGPAPPPPTPTATCGARRSSRWRPVASG
jgi:glutamate synthase domain-containing protein 2